MPYQNSNLYDNTAHLIEREDSQNEVKTIPVVTTKEGESSEVILNNKYGIEAYHRVVSQGDSILGGDGDEENEKQITTNMVCVVTNNRRKTKIKPEDLAFGIVSGFRSIIKDSEYSATGIDNIEVQITGTSLNKVNVAQAEYVDLKSLPPFYDLFSIEYSIVAELDSRCYTLC